MVALVWAISEEYGDRRSWKIGLMNFFMAVEGARERRLMGEVEAV